MRRTASPPDLPPLAADESATTASELRWDQVPTRRYAGWAVAACFFIFDVFIRMATGVVTPTLQAEFDVSAAVVSTAFGGAFFYGYGAAQLPAGTLLDSLGPKRTYVLGSLLAALGCFLFAVARSVLVGTAGRALTGVGCAVAWSNEAARPKPSTPPANLSCDLRTRPPVGAQSDASRSSASTSAPRAS